MEQFAPLHGMRNAIKRSMQKAKKNKSPGFDGVHHEMLKTDPELMSELIFETWKTIGRLRLYPAGWLHGLLTPIYKKGDSSEPGNYRPVCMLSCIRKTVKVTIVENLAASIEVHERPFGFHRGLSPAPTLLDGDSLVKIGMNKVATLDLAKAYDKVNRRLLMKDCEQRMDSNTAPSIADCLQQLTVTTKSEVTGTRSILRLDLPQGSPLSPILFLIYIDDLVDYCPRQTNRKVVQRSLGEDEITMTPDDVILYTNSWGKLQY